MKDASSRDPGGRLRMRSHASRNNQTSRSFSVRANLAQRRLESTAKILPLEMYKSKKSYSFSWWHAIFIFSYLSLLLCLLQIFLAPPFGLRMTSSEVAESGLAPDGCDDGLKNCICPRETICATDKLSMVLLALARCSVFFDYPLYMMMYLSKAHNINNFLRADMHKVHKIFGIVIGVETMFHSFLHLLRWGIDNNTWLLWTTETGITGLVAAAVTPLIVWPMVVPKLKALLSFEIRKCLHYLSWVWAAALCFHAPSRIYYLIGLPALLYFIDFLVGMFGRTHLIEDVCFERYGEKGVALHFMNPKKGFDSGKTSYVYIMCPWISKWQWHAFTMFPEPTKSNHTMLCIGSAGDWTKELFNRISAPCLRSAYVLGPFSSEFSDKAVNTTNTLAIASGIGITPTLSLMLSYAGKKRINIIWMCRDPGLVEHFLHKVDINSATKNSYAFIFYTGHQDLVIPNNLPVNFFIFRNRPNLEETISGIVAAIHSGEGLPEEMYENQKELASIPFSKRIKIALSRIVTIYSKEEMFEYAVEETNAFEAASRDNADSELGSCERECTTASSSYTDTESLGPLNESVRDITLSTGHESYPMAGAGNVISIHGLDAMICSFLGGIGEYARDDVENLFKLVDTDESGFIDKKEFDQFLDLATGEKHCNNTTRKVNMVLERTMTKTLQASRRITIESLHASVGSMDGAMIGDTSTIQYMENLINEKENPLDDWSMFYCGASDAIKKTLKGVAKKYSLGLGVEKIDW